MPVFTGEVRRLLRIEHSLSATGAEDYDARVLLAGRELIRGQVSGVAVTADGKRLALSADHPHATRDGLQTTVLVADVASGRVLARQDGVARHAEVVGWANETVVLGVPKVYSRYGRTLAWVPGSAVHSITVAMPLDVAESGDRVVSGTSNCRRVFDLLTAEFITSQRCGDDRLSAITDLGDVAVTAGLELVDVEGDAETELRLAVPGRMPGTDARISRDRRVVFTVKWRKRRWHEATIACPISGDTCVRVRNARTAAAAIHIRPAAPGCDPALLHPATPDGRPTKSPVVHHEGMGPYGVYVTYVTTVQERPCRLAKYPELVHVTGDRTVRLAPRRGPLFSKQRFPAVIDPGRVAVATVLITDDRPACRPKLRAPRAYDELHLEIGNGDTVRLRTNLRTRCPLRVGPWEAAR